MKTFILFLILSFLTLHVTYFGFSKSNKDPIQCNLYGVINIELVQKVAVNPFEVTLKGIFSGPNGEILEVPGFYNGGNQYIVRFSPISIGEWNYMTISSESKLSGKMGTIKCIEANKAMHGSIRIDPANPRHFVYEDGSPYFLLAYEFDWLFALDLDNKEDIPRTRNLVNTLADNGFNHIVMNVYADDVGWGKDPDLPDKYEFANPGIFPFSGTNSNPDFSSLNIEFFKRFDRVIELLGEKNIIAHLMIYVWNKKVSWPPMYSEADNMYFDYVIKRYQAYPNIVWDISKEALTYGRCDMNYVIERIRRVRKNDAYNRLVTVHDYQFCQKYPGKVDFISIQTWQSDLYNRMKDLYDEYPGKPVFNIEHGGYEKGPYHVFPGDYNDPETCLIRNYFCAFAGVYSTYYWQNTSWNVIIYDLENLEKRDQPKFEYYKHLASLFSKYEFRDLTPVNQSTSGYCLSNNQDLYLYFISGDHYAIHTTIPEGDKKKFKVTWFNPLSGEYTEQKTMDYSSWMEFKPYWSGQANILIIERE
jgi:hypothetical protein